MTAFNTIFHAKDTNQRLLLLTAQSAVYEFNGSTWQDITGTAVDDGADARWSGGWLTGAVTLANQKVVRTYKPGIDGTTQPMVYNGGANGPGDETWESKNYSAQVFRPFRNYMLAGNVTWDGVDYPSRVQWCHPVEPGQVPEDWVPLDTNFAGDVDLADTPGSIVDMAPLRDAMMIYKRDSIYSCQWIGGNEVFAFKRITSTKGIHARDCIVEHNGYHWCQGLEDIFILDGNRATSLLWGRAKATWLNDRDPARMSNNFTVLDYERDEVLFFYVSKAADPTWTYPDKAIVINLTNNALLYRDYGMEIPHAKVSLNITDQTSADLPFYAIDRTGSRLVDLEAAPDRLGAPVPAVIQRTGLFADPGHDWVQVDRVKVQLTGHAGTITLGDQLAIDADVTWRTPYAFDPATDYKTDARANGNLIAYKIDVQTVTNWQMANLMLLVQKSGERG